MASEIKVDTISEKTSANGVVIDGVTVKDGAIASSFISSLPTAGMTKVGDTDFSAASDVTFDNVFTSTYSNYAFKIDHQAADNNTEFRFRLRTGGASGSDDTSTEYAVINIISFPNEDTNWRAKTIYGIGQNAFTVNGGMANNKPYHATLDIFTPQKAQDTTWSGTGGYQGGHGFFIAGSFEADTQFTGIKFYQSTGNISGSIQIYGYAS